MCGQLRADRLLPREGCRPRRCAGDHTADPKNTWGRSLGQGPANCSLGATSGSSFMFVKRLKKKPKEKSYFLTCENEVEFRFQRPSMCWRTAAPIHFCVDCVAEWRSDDRDRMAQSQNSVWLFVEKVCWPGCRRGRRREKRQLGVSWG